MIKQIACAICLNALIACQAKPQIEEQFALKDLTPPQVVSITPASGTTEVTDKPTIVVVFNESMNPATLNSSTVRVATHNGTPGVGSYEYDATSFALTIKIVQSLYLNTQYTITVTSQVKDRAGNAIAPVTSTFSTDVCPKARRGKPVFNSTVFAIAKLGCTLYVGGDFTTVGEGSSFGVLLDGTSGQKMPSFTYEDINGAVHAVASDGNGGFYIGGDFTRVGSHTRNRLAHIAANGEVLPWNPGANSTVLALAVSGTTIYVGGNFTTIGGNPRNRLAALGSDGTLLNWNPGANDYIYALGVAGGIVYVGGAFTEIGGNTRNHLAAIGSDGSLQSWNPNASGNVNALAISGTTIYAGGNFTCFGNCPSGTEGVDKWTRNRLVAISTDGNLLNWNPNANNSVLTLAVSGSTIYVGGDFTCIGGVGCPNRNRLAAISITDGPSGCSNNYTPGCLLSWNPDANLPVITLAVSGTSIYAGGYFTTIGGTGRNRLAAMDIGASCLTAYTASCLFSWNPNANFHVSAIAVWGTTIYAGGYFTALGANIRNRLAAIGTDGALLTWNPNANNIVRALAISGSTVYTGGDFTTIGGNTRNRLAAIGTDGALLSWNPNASGSVFALAASDSIIYAGGSFTCFGNCPSGTEGVDKWTRNRLAAIDSAGALLSWNPNAGNIVLALTVSGPTIYAGGAFTCIGGVGCPNRNRLAAISITDGPSGCLNNYTLGCLLSWNPNADSNVRAFAVSGTTIYAGGDFTTMSGIGRNRLAAIGTDGALLSWNPDASGSVYILGISGSAIYAGGDFTTIGGTGRNRLAAISSDSALLSWNPDANFSVFALAISGTTIYAGGDFTTLGGNSHLRLASINTDGSVNW